MIAILVAVAASLIVTLLGTPIAIRFFRLSGVGQIIREDGPRGHMEKMGTPTMGGVVIIAGTVAGYLAARFEFGTFTVEGLSVLGVMIALGVVGAVDDLLKIRRRRSLGLNKRAKLAGQLMVALAFTWVLIAFTDVSTNLSFTRATPLVLGLGFYVWVFLMISASSNGVNLTDGLDGLASGSSALVLAAYIFIAFWQFRHACSIPNVGPGCYFPGVPSPLNPSLDTAIVGASAFGATAGFLWWNAAPAQIFMGDTGALALGGLLAALAIVTETQLLLLVLGGLFAVETVSVIMQVISFRSTGRRVFRMAPLHHHFELNGWPEFTVIVRFWILAGLAVAFGLGLFYADFLTRGSGG